MDGFAACFSELKDPRTGNAGRHQLLEILMIALCTVLCGGQGCVDMAEFGKAKESLLRQFLKLPHGIPSHDTFSRVFRLLEPDQFRASFLQFMAMFAEVCKGVIAVDGKQLRHSFDTASGKSPLHMVTAWASDQRLVLAQIATDEKSNEITAVPKLLKMLSLEGMIVTADALNCQRTTSAQIIEQGGDYALALKENQPSLYADVTLFLEDPETEVTDTHTTVDGDHGRIETRTAVVSTDIQWLQHTHNWPGLAAIGKITRIRETLKGTSSETAYYLLSAPLSAKRFGEVVRSEWGIENGLHWILDVVMNEDQLRNRKDNGPYNLAVLRHMAMNVIQMDNSKGSKRIKFKRAAWNDGYLLTLLSKFRTPQD